MMKHLRGKLTLFNTAVTGAILLGMTLLCLLVSQRDLKAQTFQSFSGYMDTVCANLSTQRLSADWLRQVEGNGHVTIALRDNGNPLFSRRLEGKNLEEAYAQARRRAWEEFGLNAGLTSRGGSCSFSMECGGERYYAGVALRVREGGVLELVFLYPLADLERDLARQNFVVSLGVMLALGLIFLFSWLFTGRMLRPIAENQKRQAQFTAAASHELRTPLAAMLSAASALERAEEGERPRFSAIITQEGERMSRLIGDMLTLTSGDGGSCVLRPEKIEADMLLLESFERYQPLAREKGLALSLRLPENACPELTADRDKITQVISILLDNAIAYTPAPGEIHLSLERGRRSLRFTVADSGPGVPEAERSRIFQRFHRGERSRSDRSHFGLGLSIATEIVKRHRGSLWVEDSPLGGAAFILELPEI